MNYVSTRGAAPAVSLAEVLLGALAPDGGLYLPRSWPSADREALAPAAGSNYQQLALSILRQLAGDDSSRQELCEDVAAAYGSFDHPDIAPLVELEPGLYLLELFHGPTLSFKDIALQLLARLVARELERRNARATILVATSGDTGSAAISAFGGLPRIEVFVLHPDGRVSDVQRRQMTTSACANVHNIALQGTFDDAQAQVKQLFSDHGFAGTHSLAAVNSINFVRIIAQSVYYFTASAKLGRPARFVVPTGNFGDIFAGEAAARMGLPVAGLVAATNANDILVRSLSEGIYAVREAKATLSPAMDIQIASNFERALYEASNRDRAWLSHTMAEFGRERRITLPTSVLTALRSRYQAFSVSDAETLEAIGDAHRRYGRLVDPHTAVGVAAARRVRRTDNVSTVILATAHPAKFPETVERATGVVPLLPQCLEHSYLGPERLTLLPNDARSLRAFIEARSAHHER